jgi:hypothetical protein
MQWPPDMDARMRAGAQLGAPVLTPPANDTSAQTALTLAAVFTLSQTWFAGRGSSSPACSAMPANVGAWGNAASATQALVDGALVPTPTWQNLSFFGGPSTAPPAPFAVELVTITDDDNSAASHDVLLLRTTAPEAVAAPYVLLAPGGPWQYGTLGAAVAARVAWGVFRATGSPDDAPLAFLAFTSDAVRASGAPAMLVAPVAVSVTADAAGAALVTLPVVNAAGAAVCSAGVAGTQLTGAVTLTPTNEMSVTLSNYSVFGANGEGLTWSLLLPPRVVTDSELKALKTTDKVVVGVAAGLFVVFAIVLLWGVSSKNKQRGRAVAIASGVVMALCVLVVVLWFTWLRRLALTKS